MPEKFLNKFRIPSARLPHWDYKNTGAYFVTICTHNREHYFGEINDEIMHLSSIGKIVETEWLKTLEIRPDMNLKLDEFVVMPNHFHGILIIGENEFNKPITGGIYDGGGRDAMHGRDATHGLSTADRTPSPSTHESIPSIKNKFGPQSKNLGSIIRGFKSSVTKQVKKMYRDNDGRDATHGKDATHGVSTAPIITAPFAWQTRFHDHIIRDPESFHRIRQYIINNPLNWKEDKFYK